MKEFTTAVEDVVAEDEREAKIAALVEQGKTRADAEAEVDDNVPVEFSLDGRVMKAYKPTDGQLMFMLAAVGRGQTNDGRMSAIVNVMLNCLADEDQDYLESRLLERDPKRMIKPSTIEAIFEYLVEEWFARPTQ